MRLLRSGGWGLVASTARRTVPAVLAVLLPSAAAAGTVVLGTVEGTWGPGGSPYWVEGDLLVAAGRTLTIEPGAEVRFRGPYRLMVNGTLEAVGAADDSILFTWDQPIPSMEWRGVRLVGAAAGTRLEYCRIERVRSSQAYPEVQGGAIFCSACAPEIRHCLLQHNVSHNSNSNGMGGGVACVEASAVIESCVIRANQADSGGGICTMEACVPLIRNNRIEDNVAPYAGGGIYAGVRSSPVIENNVIRGNRAQGWGGGGITLWNWYAVFPASKTVRNNIVADNWTSAVGGGFYIRYDYSVLENNTVTGNTANGGGGGAYVLNAGPGDYPPEIRSFILWGNTGGTHPSIYLDPSTGSAAHVTYSDVAGGWTGAGNIDEDPAFVDADLHLDPEASPCVDAGDPALAFEDACFPPSLGTERNDMGAYGGPAACGWPPDPNGLPDGTVPATPGPGLIAGLGAAPNPGSGVIRVAFDLARPARVTVRVVDASGTLVRALADGAAVPGGTVVFQWDGHGRNGRRVAAGVYFLRIDAVEPGSDRAQSEAARLVVTR